MKSGKMDRRITIRRPGSPTDDGYNTLPGALADYYTCFAQWKPGRGNEIFENKGLEAYSAGTFIIRRNPTSAAIRSTDKVSYSGLSWNIISVAEMGRDAIELAVVSGEADDLPAAES